MLTFSRILVQFIFSSPPLFSWISISHKLDKKNPYCLPLCIYSVKHIFPPLDTRRLKRSYHSVLNWIKYYFLYENFLISLRSGHFAFCDYITLKKNLPEGNYLKTIMSTQWVFLISLFSVIITTPDMSWCSISICWKMNKLFSERNGKRSIIKVGQWIWAKVLLTREIN